MEKVMKSVARAGSGDVTIDHGKMRRWIEERNGRPAIVRATRAGGPGVLRVDFGKPEPGLEQISWEDFFRIFEENELAFLYQEKTRSGTVSRFFKFIGRSRRRGRKPMVKRNNR